MKVKELIQELQLIENKEMEMIFHQLVYIGDENLIVTGDTSEINILKVEDNTRVHISTGLTEGTVD